jgi:hypothetical protein
MHLLTQEHILRLSEELSSAQEKAELEKKMREDLSQITQGHVLRLSEELSSAQEKIASLEQTVQPLKEKAILAEQKRKMREDLFGKAKWEKYFGDIGVEPPLPKDIMEVLKNPCPYWEGKKVEETHMLVLIPKTVDGKLLTLNTLQELIQNPKGGGHPTKYSTYYDVIQKECQPVSASYWALITKDVLPNSRNKTYAEQQTLIKGSYAVPGALEVTTAILMRHVQTGERIYTDNPWTYTRCQELLSNGYRVWVGGFGSSGLGLCRDFDSGRHDNVGLSGVRKF